MGAYQQMGHDSENLLQEEHLGGFRGAILSPVNYEWAKVKSQIERMRPRTAYEMIFDPQLYFPNTQRGVLREWAYFPSDVDTADVSSDGWWRQVVDRLVTCCLPLSPHAICSPSVVPRVWSDAYYASIVRVCSELSNRLRGTPMRAVQTVPVDLADLSQPGRALAIASIVSRTRAESVYLIAVGTLEPRRELPDTEGLKGFMRLISALEGADLPVLVGFCSSDMLLWKAAGATSVATGKFFNLRRFTSARFEEPSRGGGQLPYWFEENLVAFLREVDLIRVRRLGLLSQATLTNPYGQEILAQLDTTPGEAWVGRGWRQFLYWFADAEQRIDSGLLSVADVLASGERRWLGLEDQSVLMEEPRNDGGWLRPWRRALAEYSQH